jgi:Raf kinase inhibitor-like YbhB/YbcL family protein
MRSTRAGFRLKGFALLLAAAGGCHGAPKPELGSDSPSLQLTTTSFPTDGAIPASLTCDGPNTSPALAWSDPPASTKSFALILEDPDAPMGTFVHWVLYNLPAAARSLPAALPAQAELADGSRQGKNDFPAIGYSGPCPPGHKPHHYRFVLYALDTPLNLPASATRQQVEDALKGHIVARGRLVGVYSH